MQGIDDNLHSRFGWTRGHIFLWELHYEPSPDRSYGVVPPLLDGESLHISIMRMHFRPPPLVGIRQSRSYQDTFEHT